MPISDFRDPAFGAVSASGRWQADAAVCAKMDKFKSYWQTLVGARGALPARRDFDPTAVPDLLPSLLLVEMRAPDGGGTLRHRVQLAGTRIAAAMGADIAGYDLESLPREDGARALAAGVDLCLAQRRPIPGEFTVVSGPAGCVADRVGRIAGFRFLAAPFSEPHAAPAIAMMLVVFVAADGGEVWAEWLGTSATA